MKKTKLFMLTIVVFSLAFAYNCKNEDITNIYRGGDIINPMNKRIPSGVNVPFRDDFESGHIPSDFWQLCWAYIKTYNGNTWNRFFKNTEGYECVRVEDGYLKLTAKKGTGPANLNYKTGGVWTLNNRFGIGTSLKVRAKLYREGQDTNFYVPSAFPAIWYNSLFSNWPEEGEIDIMEWVNVTSNKSHSTIHYRDTNGNTNTYTNRKSSTNTNLNVAEWHVYRCDLYSNNIVIYYDSNEVFRYTNSFTNIYPFNDHYYNIILNASLGNGNWGCAVESNDSNLPYEMWVDWVEVSLIDKITGKPLK